MKTTSNSFIILGENKQPVHSLDKLYKLDEIKDQPNIGMIVDEPFVVLDLDDSDQFNILLNIIEKENVNCKVMRTTRGGHFWFKSLNPLTNHVHINTPIGLETDIRSWGKKSYVVIKKDGKMREWIRNPENVDILPFWLKPIKYKKELVHLTEGDGRDPALFSYIIPLLNLKFTKTEIEKIFDLINKYVFDKPLLDREISKMFDNEIFDDTQRLFFDKRQFLHHEFAEWLKKSHFIEYYAGSLYMYENGFYKADEMQIERQMINQIPSLTQHQRKETLAYLKLLTTNSVSVIDGLTVNTESGLLSLTDSKLIPHTPYVFSINQIPVKYNPDAYDESVDNTLNRLTLDDIELRYLIEEMLGYLLINDCRYQKAFILLGQGSNGKSIFLKMITQFLGNVNVSSLALEELDERFKTAELIGKMSNIGDDISNELISNSSIFKKVVTGDRITVEKKGMDPTQFNNKAKLIFSANSLPPISDKSYGLMRRLIIIPFKAKFSKKDKDFDPNILEKITTPNAKSYLLNLALKGVKRLIKNNGFTEPDVTTEVLKDYETDNNNVLQWLENEPTILNRPSKEVYQNYTLYCANMNTVPYKVRKFNTEVKNRFPQYELKVETHDGKSVQIWRNI